VLMKVMEKQELLRSSTQNLLMHEFLLSRKGVDSLAIAIGTSHGLYLIYNPGSCPKIDVYYDKMNYFPRNFFINPRTPRKLKPRINPKKGPFLNDAPHE